MSSIHNPNVIWQNHSVKYNDRVKRYGHPGASLWFTGLSGSGKSTIANSLELVLHKFLIHTYLLDGDNLRYGLCQDLGFSDEDRKENIRRISHVAQLMVDAGLIVLTTCISPYRNERQKVRDIFKKNKFIEVFVDTPIEICEQRDPKGLYKKARSGNLKNFTGIDGLYEIPNNPDIYLNGTQSLEKNTHQLLNYLSKQDIIQFY